MRTYHIQEPDLIIKKQVQATLDGLSKPIGSLGKLEGVARKIATIQKTLTPTLTHPHHLILWETMASVTNRSAQVQKRSPGNKR